jgi:hypothetical protein
MKSFFSEYIERGAYSLLLTSLIAFLMQSMAPSLGWAILVGIAATVGNGVVFKEGLRKLKSPYLEGLVLGDRYLLWLGGLSIVTGGIMVKVFMYLTKVEYAILLGLLSGIASFLCLIILYYEKD